MPRVRQSITGLSFPVWLMSLSPTLDSAAQDRPAGFFRASWPWDIPGEEDWKSSESSVVSVVQEAVPLCCVPCHQHPPPAPGLRVHHPSPQEVGMPP